MRAPKGATALETTYQVWPVDDEGRAVRAPRDDSIGGRVGNEIVPAHAPGKLSSRCIGRAQPTRSLAGARCASPSQAEIFSKSKEGPAHVLYKNGETFMVLRSAVSCCAEGAASPAASPVASSSQAAPTLLAAFSSWLLRAAVRAEDRLRSIARAPVARHPRVWTPLARAAWNSQPGVSSWRCCQPRVSKAERVPRRLSGDGGSVIRSIFLFDLSL